MPETAVGRLIYRSNRMRSNEFAGFDNNPFRNLLFSGASGRNLLAPLDDLRVKFGGSSGEGLDIYLDLLTETHVYAHLSRKWQEIINRGWTIKAGGDRPIDEEAAEFARFCFENFGIADNEVDQFGFQVDSGELSINSLIRGAGICELTGIQPVEWIYGKIEWKGQTKIAPISVKFKDPRRFQYIYETYQDDNGVKRDFVRPVLKTFAGSGFGEDIPGRKFTFYRFYSAPAEDPYGYGIGRYLYWPVHWKRQLLTLWLQLIDRDVNGVPIGYYPDGADSDEIAVLEDILANIGPDATASLREGFRIEYLNNDGLSVSTDSLLALINYLDKEMSLVISGEATTGEQVSGSQSREEINNSIRVSTAKGLSDIIDDTTSKTIIKWITQWNYPQAALPVMTHDFSDQDLISATIGAVRDLDSAGYRAQASFVEERTGIPLEKPEEEGENGSGSGQDLRGDISELTQLMANPQNETPPESLISEGEVSQTEETELVEEELVAA